MTKHSKNNTASSIFSYHEYKKLDYGTKRQRLGNESMRPYDACALCLQKARETVACNEGHLFCKECVYSDLLKQKKDIKRQKARLEALKKEAEEERVRAKAEARARVLKEFERGQLGLGLGIGTALTKEKEREKEQEKRRQDEKGKENEETEDSKDTKDEPRGTKRKASVLDLFDSSQVESLTLEAETAALEQIKREQAESLKAKLPDFWLPSLTPTYSGGPGSIPKELKDVKVVATCRGGREAHEISLKSLVPVTYTYPKDLPPGVKNPADRRDAICPSCKKSLSNNTILFLMLSCSHVVCKTCTDTLVRPSNQCVVCDTPAPKDKIIELKREGTGYAGGGLAETSKSGVAFQG